MRGLGSGHMTCGPMRGLEINFTGRGQTDRHTYIHTDGHCDSMTDPAQRAEPVKIGFIWGYLIKLANSGGAIIFREPLLLCYHISATLRVPQAINTIFWGFNCWCIFFEESIM